MKLDKSSYYPKSNLEDDEPEDWLEQKNTVRIVEGHPEFVEIEEEVNIENNVEKKVEKKDDDNSQYLDDDGNPESPINKFVNVICTILSWVFVPLLMPIYGMIIAFKYSLLSFMPMGSKMVFTLIAFCFTVAIPMLLVVLMKRLGMIQDIGLNGRKERFIPYLITIISMAGTGIFMWYKGAPMWLNMFFIAGGVAGLVNMVINFRWKISAHAAGIAGVVALILRISGLSYHHPGVDTLLIISIVIAGLLGSARIWQGRHTMWQVLAGYAVGFTSVILMTLI